MFRTRHFMSECPKTDGASSVRFKRWKKKTHGRSKQTSCSPTEATTTSRNALGDYAHFVFFQRMNMRKRNKLLMSKWCEIESRFVSFIQIVLRKSVVNKSLDSEKPPTFRESIPCCCLSFGFSPLASLSKTNNAAEVSLKSASPLSPSTQINSQRTVHTTTFQLLSRPFLNQSSSFCLSKEIS